jgi:hypothetical protein
MTPTVKFAIARMQGLFYVATGIWPIVHMDSFLAVTGPKTDLWLVQTFGALLAGLGGVMLASTTEERLGLTCKRLGIAVASVLAGADLLFALRGTISIVYLADAAIELLFVVAWLVTIGADRTLRRRVAQAAGFPGHNAVPR